MDLARKLLTKELSTFNIKLSGFIASPIPLLDKIMKFIIKRKGKQFRPLLTLLTAKICGNVNDSIYRAAACIEILHTATIIHDDVVDNSNQRRGFFSINAIWKNKIAVLAGDYLLSKGMLIALENKEYKILQILSSVVKQMSEAELLQLEKARGTLANEEIYFQIIKGKTGVLIQACCILGAMMQDNPDATQIKKMTLIGEKIGAAFQIKDDLLDYGTNFIGKPKAQDIKEKKLTLPLIYTLKNANVKDRKKIIAIIKHHNTNNSKIKEVLTMCKNLGGIRDANLKLEEIKNEALIILQTFENSKYKNALLEMIKKI